MEVVPGSISYQTGKLMGAETLGSVGNNWSWHAEAILNQMLVDGTNS